MRTAKQKLKERPKRGLDMQIQVDYRDSLDLILLG